ncbi:unnamed protein product [Symbiodinium sp. CCMP2592]|nr:unnamed protein product [Symbiodinium sp. CCMP2592]
MKGSCPRADRCVYAHGSAELRPSQAPSVVRGQHGATPSPAAPSCLSCASAKVPEVVFTVDKEEERRRAERAKRFAPRQKASFEAEEKAPPPEPEPAVEAEGAAFNDMGLNEEHSESAESVTSFSIGTDLKSVPRVTQTFGRTKSPITSSRCSSITVLFLQVLQRCEIDASGRRLSDFLLKLPGRAGREQLLARPQGGARLLQASRGRDPNALDPRQPLGPLPECTPLCVCPPGFQSLGSRNGQCCTTSRAKGERDKVYFLSSRVCEEIGLSLHVFVQTLVRVWTCARQMLHNMDDGRDGGFDFVEDVQAAASANVRPPINFCVGCNGNRGLS